jgi:hypothetical protein
LTFQVIHSRVTANITQNPVPKGTPDAQGGNVRNSVESSDSRVTHSTTPFYA